MTISANISALIDREATPQQKQLLTVATAIAAELDTPVYLVGGAVRDLLATGDLHDLDLVVEGDGIELARQLAERLDGELTVHSRFLTAEVVSNDLTADIVTARRETYPDPAALPVVYPGNLDDDLARRDFTINSMAYPLAPADAGELIDPFDGRQDLERKILRVLHERSFFDDPTRILRAVRLGARLGLSMEPGTHALASAAVKSGAFEPLSPSRLRQELRLLLDAPEGIEGLRQLEGLGFLSSIGIEEPLTAALWETLGSLSRKQSAPSSADSSASRIRWWLAYLMVLVGKTSPAGRQQLARSLGLDEDLQRSVLQAPERLARLAAELSTVGLAPHRVRQALDSLTTEELVVLELTDSPRLEAWLGRWREELGKIELEIGGAELLEAGFATGPELGEALAATHEARLDGLIDAGQELEFASRLLSKRDSRERSKS
jgi:tRNA nucleotidyltransferase (CCA-adding enzyme)